MVGISLYNNPMSVLGDRCKLYDDVLVLRDGKSLRSHRPGDAVPDIDLQY